MSCHKWNGEVFLTSRWWRHGSFQSPCSLRQTIIAIETGNCLVRVSGVLSAIFFSSKKGGSIEKWLSTVLLLSFQRTRIWFPALISCDLNPMYLQFQEIRYSLWTLHPCATPTPIHRQMHINKKKDIVKINLRKERYERQGAQRGCKVSLESEITELLRT